MKKDTKNLINILRFITVGYPFLWVWQGIDVTDLFFSLVNSSLIFTHPESVHYSYPIIVANWVGALGLKLGANTLLGYRVFSALLVTVSIIISSRLLTKLKFDSVAIWACLLATTVYITHAPSFIWSPNYNLVSGFILHVAIVLLAYAFINPYKRSLKLVFAGGVLAGLALFARFPPNILAVGYIVGIALYVIHTYKIGPPATVPKQSMQRSLIVYCGSFFVGWLTGIALVLLIIAAGNQTEPFMTSLQEMLAGAADKTGHHNFSWIMKVYLTSLLTALAYGGLFLAYLKTVQHRFNMSIIGIIFGILGLGVVAYQNVYHFYFLVLGICLWCLPILAWKHRKNSEYLFIIYLVVINVATTPFGSGQGFRNAGYGMWLLMPFAWLLYIANGKSANKQHGLHNWFWPLSITVIILAFSIRVTHNYREASDLFSLNSPLNDPKFVGQYTTKARADSINELVEAITPIAKAGERALFLGNIPFLYYVTDMIPTMGTSWPIFLHESEFTQKLNHGIRAHGLPKLIVEAKYSTRSPNWPTEKNPRAHKPRETRNYEYVRQLTNEKYKKSWENDFFIIFIPLP